jgi:tetratricopeptide (TPR) repeat protein
LLLGTVFPHDAAGPQIVLDVVDPVSGEALGESIQSAGPGDPVRDAASRAASRIAGAFDRPKAARGDHPDSRVPPKFEAYLAFAEALAAFAAMDIPAAEAHARRAVEIDSSFAPARIELAVQLGNRGDFEGAAALVSSLGPDPPGLTLWDRERLEWIDAVLDADRGRRLAAAEREGPWRTHHQWAYELAGLGRMTESNAVLRRAERASRFPELRAREASQWAINLHDLGLHEAELRLVRRRRDDLGQPRGARFEIRALVALGRLRDAEERVTSGPARLGPDQAALAYELGIELMAHGSEARGLQWLNRAADALPAGPPGSSRQRLRTEALYAAGRWTEARAGLEARLTAAPHDINARGALAVIDSRTGYPARARAAADSLIAEPLPVQIAAGTVWRARIAAALGDHSEVPHLLETARQRGAARPAASHRAPEWRFLPDRSVLEEWLAVR